MHYYFRKTNLTYNTTTDIFTFLHSLQCEFTYKITIKYNNNNSYSTNLTLLTPLSVLIVRYLTKLKKNITYNTDITITLQHEILRGAKK